MWQELLYIGQQSLLRVVQVHHLHPAVAQAVPQGLSVEKIGHQRGYLRRVLRRAQLFEPGEAQLFQAEYGQVSVR